MAVCGLVNAGLTIFEPTICSNGPHAKPAQLWWLCHLSCINSASFVSDSLRALRFRVQAFPIQLCSIVLLGQGSKAVDGSIFVI